MTNTTTTSGAADLLTLIEAYAEAFHRHGHSRYYAQTAAALQAVKDALAAGQATAAPAQPAAQQGAAYAEMPEKYYLAGGEVPTWDAKQMHAFADATNTLRASHGQAPAGATKPTEQQILEAAFAPAQPAPATQQAVDNSRFDYKTAADFLSGKTVSDEALRKFVAASRGAHDARAALHAKMLSLQGELASREAEIALLKRSLLDAEADAAAPRPSTTAQSADSVQEDAARLDFMIEQRAYVVSDPDTCTGHWLHWARPDGSTWVQVNEHPTPRAAIDAARKQEPDGSLPGGH